MQGDRAWMVAGVGVVDPFAQQWARVSGVDDLFDPEAFGGAERGAHSVQACADLFDEGRGIVAGFQLSSVGSFDPALDGKRAPVRRGPGVTLNEAVPIGHACAADAEDAPQNNLCRRYRRLIDSSYGAHAVADRSFTLGIAPDYQPWLIGQGDDGQVEGLA